MNIILILIIFILSYAISGVIIYGWTSNEIAKQNKKITEEEAALLMRMIIFFPLFASEIPIIIKRMEKKW